MTAVEWLFEQMPKKLHPHYKKQLEQAKAMEKEQIEDAYDAGIWDIGCKAPNFDEYYKRTFKQE